MIGNRRVANSWHAPRAVVFWFFGRLNEMENTMPQDFPLALCPHCGVALHSATPDGHPDAQLTPGSLGTCDHCGEWIIFVENLELQKPDIALLKILNEDPNAIAHRQKVLEYIREQKDAECQTETTQH